jgi:hypothetical protein
MDPDPDPAAADALLAGRYELGPLVGLGGTAAVHRAWDRSRFCCVAVKIFQPGAAAAPGHADGRELKLLAGVRHPGLVGVRDAGVDAHGRPFVVMDFIDGDSLCARLHDGPLPAASVSRIGAVLADALAVVHARGIVHRDVKPANVLLDADGHPWLTDFGIARIVDATRVTATGVVVGTAAYMAPEQVRGTTVGPAADVYALGLVLLEAFTGRREYDGSAIESAMARLHRAPVVPEAVPHPLAAVLRHMTATDPVRRPTAAEVAAVLNGPAAPARAVPVRRRVAPAAALACLVAAALAGGLAVASDGSAERPVVAAAPVPAPVAVPPEPVAPAAPAPPAVPPAVDTASAARPPAARSRPVALSEPDRSGTRSAPRPDSRRSDRGGGSRERGTDEPGARSAPDEGGGDDTGAGSDGSRKGGDGDGKGQKDKGSKGKGREKSGKDDKGDR